MLPTAVLLALSFFVLVEGRECYYADFFVCAVVGGGRRMKSKTALVA